METCTHTYIYTINSSDTGFAFISVLMCLYHLEALRSVQHIHFHNTPLVITQKQQIIILNYFEGDIRIYIYISQLIASKIIVIVYIIYVCVLCICIYIRAVNRLHFFYRS